MNWCIENNRYLLVARILLHVPATFYSVALMRI